MNPATAQNNPFHPYTVTAQTGSSVDLQPPAKQKTTLLVLRLAPLVLLVIGLVLFVLEKQSSFLLLFGGLFLLEMLLLSFVKLPGAVSLDAIGLSLEQLSIKGAKSVYYPWNDVDYIRYRTVQRKQGTLLVYDAVRKDGKKTRFLQFPEYRRVRDRLPEINARLEQISHRVVKQR